MIYLVPFLCFLPLKLSTSGIVSPNAKAYLSEIFGGQPEKNREKHVFFGKLAQSAKTMKNLIAFENHGWIALPLGPPLSGRISLQAFLS